MIGKIAIAALVLGAAAASSSAAGPADGLPKNIPWKIDELTAQRLVVEANSYHFLPFRDYEGDNFDAPFYVFAMIDPDRQVLMIQGWFAVNAWTGEV